LKKNNYLIINANLGKGGRSLCLSQILIDKLNKNHNIDSQSKIVLLDEFQLPLCDGKNHLNNPIVSNLSNQINNSNGIIICTPIYNYYVNSGLKNLIEMTGSAWKEKIIGFTCLAGGEKSYMSIMSFSNSLMLDHRCIIIPRFVYVKGNDFISDTEVKPEIDKRLNFLVADLIKFVEALS